MMDLVRVLTTLPREADIAAAREQLDAALQAWAQAEGVLSALRVRSMEAVNQALPPDTVMHFKRAERARDDAVRLAQASVAPLRSGLSTEALEACDAEIRRAEGGLAVAVQQHEADAIAGKRAGPERSMALGRALFTLAWAMCDYPIAMRIMDTGRELQRRVS